VTTDSTARRFDALTDVAGLRVGHYHRIGRGWLTGTTLVRCPANTVASVDVRGGAPGTRETDLLSPLAMMPAIQAIVLTGGSAFGLAAADGVMRWLADRHDGYRVGAEPHQVVPIVPAAVLFDLGRGGQFANTPDASFGERAIGAARPGAIAQGCVGAGAGAMAGGMKGGIGTASTLLDNGVTVSALVAVNAAGATIDVDTGLPYGVTDPRTVGLRKPTRSDVQSAAAFLAAQRAAGARPLNTALAVVATDAALTKAECARLAGAGQNGFAVAIRPVHTTGDGDVVFALATGTRELPLPEAPFPGANQRSVALTPLLAAAAEVTARSVVNAMVAATGIGDFLAYRDLYPSALR
jgi:L-aminopeptidase/D-esterase-like protein